MRWGGREKIGKDLVDVCSLSRPSLVSFWYRRGLARESTWPYPLTSTIYVFVISHPSCCGLSTKRQRRDTHRALIGRRRRPMRRRTRRPFLLAPPTKIQWRQSRTRRHRARAVDIGERLEGVMMLSSSRQHATMPHDDATAHGARRGCARKDARHTVCAAA